MAELNDVRDVSSTDSVVSGGVRGRPISQFVSMDTHMRSDPAECQMFLSSMQHAQEPLDDGNQRVPGRTVL